MSDVSAPTCKNRIYPPLWPVSVAQKNMPQTMSSSNVYSINLTTDCMARRFWMRHWNGCLRSSAAKQWIVTTGSTDKEAFNTVYHRNLTWKLLQLLIDRHIVCMIIELVVDRRPSAITNWAGSNTSRMVSHKHLSWNAFSSSSTSLFCQS